MFTGPELNKMEAAFRSSAKKQNKNLKHAAALAPLNQNKNVTVQNSSPQNVNDSSVMP